MPQRSSKSTKACVSLLRLLCLLAAISGFEKGNGVACHARFVGLHVPSSSLANSVRACHARQRPRVRNQCRSSGLLVRPAGCGLIHSQRWSSVAKTPTIPASFPQMTNFFHLVICCEICGFSSEHLRRFGNLCRASAAPLQNAPGAKLLIRETEPGRHSRSGASEEASPSGAW